MYWPIGPPRVYELQLPLHLISSSEDGLRNGRRLRKSRGRDRPDSEHSGHHAVGAEEAARYEIDDSSSVVNDAEEVAQSAAAQPENAPAQSKTIEVNDEAIIGLRVSRTGQTFATVTKTGLTVWQTKPTVVLASVVRSRRSIEMYGLNVSLLLRPEADILVLQTSEGYLITYSFGGDTEAGAYELNFADGGRLNRRRSDSNTNKYAPKAKGSLLDGGGFVREATLQFRMVIKLDAGISKALALDHELVIITKTPPAVQCIRWSPDRQGSQTNTELLSNMPWLEGNKTLADIVYDRPMSIFAFVSVRGRAYAVQRLTSRDKEGRNSDALFDGHIFHTPTSDNDIAVKAAINSRFSLIALGCNDGSICLFSVRDYAGGIKLLRKVNLPVSSASSGKMTTLSYSPDGYFLFAGYENGWMTWSVFGQPGGSSFGSDMLQCDQNGDYWLKHVLDACWVGGGSDLIILGPDSNKFSLLEFARSAATTCFTPANIFRSLLQTSTGLMIYQGDQLSDLTALAADVSLWQHVEVPSHYVAAQWPLRAVVISPDRRYLAVAGQRGLAHYSIVSGRWRTFSDPSEENDFVVRGGMCWHHHILIVAVETSTQNHEIRVYSRELPLENSKVLHTTALSAAVVHLTPSGNESILVYDHENSLNHYLIAATTRNVELVKVGQIALHGIIRAPLRVRAVSWIVPEHQIQNGEPSQDVSVASVFFLVDGKLVLLQPSTNEDGDLKYEMRIVAHHVEFFMLARDHPANSTASTDRRPSSASSDHYPDNPGFDYSLKDSLWLFDGQDVKVWPDVTDLLNSGGADQAREFQKAITVPVDFYPLSTLIPRGIVIGAEAELVQRRDSSFAYYNIAARTTLFLPNVLRHYLSQLDTSAAHHLCHHFQHLHYFAHALEVLLHNVLDDEVEQGPDQGDSNLPTVLSFLSSFPEYLDVVVQCTRKTELRSWRTLFAYLPPPSDLFEASLKAGSLKTAGGYLLVLHTLSEITSTSPQVIRLLRTAKAAQDWDLCKELARFLVALDETGSTLREALELVDLGSPRDSRKNSRASPEFASSDLFPERVNGVAEGRVFDSLLSRVETRVQDENFTPRPSAEYLISGNENG